MLFTYFKEIPKEIIEAGKMDGVTTWGEIKDILIPLAWGGIASTALLTFIFCWNEAYWTVRLTTIDAATLSKLIEGNRAPEGSVLWPSVCCVYRRDCTDRVLGWFCQKQLVAGLTFGASNNVERRPTDLTAQNVPCHGRCWWHRRQCGCAFRGPWCDRLCDDIARQFDGVATYRPSICWMRGWTGCTPGLQRSSLTCCSTTPPL